MFLEMKSRGEFLESAYVHGHYYGTSRPWIESKWLGAMTCSLKSIGKRSSGARKI